MWSFKTIIYTGNIIVWKGTIIVANIAKNIIFLPLKFILAKGYAAIADNITFKINDSEYRYEDVTNDKFVYKFLNKYEDLIKAYYDNNIEDDRLRTRKSHKIEYITTMHYIKKFAKKGCKILEVGAGTGVYSVELAKMGYNVTAVELVESNVEILKKNAEGIKNIKCFQGDALDLSRFNDNEFDIVLNLGPMYHLYTAKDRNKAISESLRVCKKSGISMFAYLTHSSIVWSYGIIKRNIKHLSGFMTKKGEIKPVPKEIFASYFNEDFNKQFEKTKSTHITSVATDGLAQILREYMNNQEFTEEDYELFVKWHLATCERLDHQGLSSHMLYICKKD